MHNSESHQAYVEALQIFEKASLDVIFTLESNLTSIQCLTKTSLTVSALPMNNLPRLPSNIIDFERSVLKRESGNFNHSVQALRSTLIEAMKVLIAKARDSIEGVTQEISKPSSLYQETLQFKSFLEWFAHSLDTLEREIEQSTQGTADDT